MKLEGWRKFASFILTIISFTIIVLTKPVDIISVGLALTAILSSFGGANVAEHFAKSKKNETK